MQSILLFTISNNFKFLISILKRKKLQLINNLKMDQLGKQKLEATIKNNFEENYLNL